MRSVFRNSPPQPKAWSLNGPISRLYSGGMYDSAYPFKRGVSRRKSASAWHFVPTSELLSGLGTRSGSVEPSLTRCLFIGVTSHLVTDMCMYSHAIVGVSPHDYGRAMVGYICPTHTVSVTYKLGVTAAGMIGHAPSPRPTEGKRPIAAAAAASTVHGIY